MPTLASMPGNTPGMLFGRAAFTSVEADPEGLRIALREIFEESYIAGETEALFESDDVDGMRRADEDVPARSLSPGYYSRAAYLLDLASAIECGVCYGANELTRSDVQGIDMVRRAKNMFEGDHPACPGCGRRLDGRYLPQCPHCQTKFAGRGN